MDTVGSEEVGRAFTMKALILNVLLYHDDVGVRCIQTEIFDLTGGVEVGHSAVFTASKILVEGGLAVVRKGPRSSGGGPPVLSYRITDEGRRVARQFLAQAERFRYWQRFKAEIASQASEE